MAKRFMLDSLNARVRRFGVELEVLDLDYDYDDDDSCNCEECVAERGYEYDRHSLTGDRAIMLNTFREFDLTEHSHQHAYHCGCFECAYERTDGSFFAAQSDCTVGAEYVSRIVDLDCREDVNRLSVATPEALDVVYDKTGWHPDGDRNNGNHIHVGVDGSGERRFYAQTVRRAADWLGGLAAEFNFTPLADGGCGRIRSYNGNRVTKAANDPWNSGRQYRGDAGSWFSGKFSTSSGWRDPENSLATVRNGTLEFRMWNTPLETSRVPIHAALSVALMRWGLTMAIRYADVTSLAGQDAHIENLRSDRIVSQIRQCVPHQFPGVVQDGAEVLLLDTFTDANRSGN